MPKNRRLRLNRAPFEARVGATAPATVRKTGKDSDDQVRALHDPSRAKPGVLVYPQITKVDDGSPLARRIPEEFPEVTLQPGTLMGEALATSPNLSLEAIQAFSQELAAQSLLTTRAMDRLGGLWMRPAESFEGFCDAHPELVDAEGVLAVSRATQLQGFRWDGAMADHLAGKLTRRHV